jgi:retron-type reverse transcriptase
VDLLYAGKQKHSNHTGETLRVSTAKGCPQGGVLSPLLWSLAVDELLRELNDSGYYTVGYADDIAILINGKFPQTVSEVLQTVQQWCKRTNLSINPNKMVIILFTSKRDIRGLRYQSSSTTQSSCPARSSTLD